MFSVPGLAVAVFAVALALTVGDADEALAGKKKGGCPSGSQKFVKVCIETQSRSLGQPFDNASADCADEAGRLPTGAELDAFRQQDGILLGEGQRVEWTGDIFGEEQRSLAIADDGTEAIVDQSTGLPYRCVK